MAPSGAGGASGTRGASEPGVPRKPRNWRQDMPTVDAYWMNRVLFDVHHKPNHLERYKAGPDEYMAAIPLPIELKAAIRNNDIGAMYLAGVNPYLLRAHCLGLQLSEQLFVQSLRAVGDGPSEGGTEARHG